MLDNKLQQGTSLYLSLMIMTILLSIALGLSTIFIGQSKMIKALGNSVIAFYAADAGVEEVLINRSNPLDIPQTSLPNGATYQVFVAAGGVGDCASENNYCIKSVGIYQETRRAIEIVY
ncbi:hypothetical protein ES703_63401 [subsurface metagenome]